MDYIDVKLSGENTPKIIAKLLETNLKNACKSLVFLFIGSDGNMGDSLAPLCGTILNLKEDGIFCYGDLNCPITAKEAPFVAEFIKNAHPESLVAVIDAAVGRKEDLGLIKVQNCGIKPGLGVNKNLPSVGDFSIIGILGEKTCEKSVLTVGRLSTVYEMANNIAQGIQIFVQNNKKRLYREELA